jgi:glycosyltransferase involved in cell wall biosynthesis
MARRLAVVISSIEPGGAEGIAVRLCNAWAQAGSAVSLATLFDRQRQLALHPAIEHLNLGTAQGDTPKQSGPIAGNLSRVAAIRKVIKASSPDYVVSHMDQTNILVLMAGVGLGRRTIVVEHVDPRHHGLGPGWSLLRRLTYPRADSVVTVCRGMLDAYPASIRANAVAIPNPVVVPDTAGQAQLGGKSIVAMGRLTHQKGFDVLVRAFAVVARQHPDATLTIWGEGPERERIAALAESVGVGAHVRLPGFAGQPFEALLQGSMFVLPSRYEGFGLALAEAMALGMPVVATRCPSGPDEIVRDGVDGLLVPPEDPSRLGAAICAVLGDQRLASRLAHNAREVRERFSLERALDRWEHLFDRLRRAS